ncbi:MAG: S41 family peptidase, partial [Pyrinomonadaceae bacterium]
MSQLIKLLLRASLCVACLASVNFLTSHGVSLAAKASANAQRKRARRVPAARLDFAGARRVKTFQLVWQTVRDEHFDQTFGGVNWDAVRTRYAPRAAATRSDRELHYLLQAMIDELHQSHFAIIPPENIPRFDRRKSGPGGGAASGVAKSGDEEETPEDDETEGSADLATRMLNGVGVDVRILNSQVVITRVAEGGPASRAGLRIGFIIKSVDGEPLESGARYLGAGGNATTLAYFQMRQELLVNYLGGEPGTDVRLTYLDEGNKEREVVIKRERLGGELSSPVGNLPPMYVEFEARRLPDGAGYLRFSAFTPGVAERICGALRSMSDAPGVVIDMRGNPGGVMGLATGVTGLLTTKAGLIGSLYTRKGGLTLPTFPQKSPYTGPVAVLIDGLSGSTAEVFAAALQESGRAVIVGERSAGMVLGADTLKLPTGALFVYARAGFITAQGTALEGRGVTPDVEKKLDRDALLKGRDDQLEEAIRQLQPKDSRRAEVALPPTSSAPLPIVVSSVAPDSPPSSVSPHEDARATGDGHAVHKFESTREAERVMERYINALGGREALGRVK